MQTPGLTVRQRMILKSPMRDGSATKDSRPYLKELGVAIENCPLPIQFNPNTSEPIHRWAPYVQGFSASFVENILNRYKADYNAPVIHDPFAGCGTVLVQAKRRGLDCHGVELNPLLHFVSKTKVDHWRVSPSELREAARRVLSDKQGGYEFPCFLKTREHFAPKVLSGLETIRGAIDREETSSLRDLMLLGFSAILVDNSKLKRAPCLGYAPGKTVAPNNPAVSFDDKISDMADDLTIVQKRRIPASGKCVVHKGNSMTFKHRQKYDLVITSPPYMNGLDYVMNYKIEMAWLDFAENAADLKEVKNSMVVCDNVSKGLIRDFSRGTERYSNAWIASIKRKIAKNISVRGSYRRTDMPGIVHKYFDDMHQVLQQVVGALKRGGRLVMVVGDSLIADCYVPTDLILAYMGREMGLTVERIEKARERRSGQVRSYRLRETIITLKKEA